MTNFDSVFLSKEFLERWDINFKKLEKHIIKHGPLNGQVEGELARWVEHQIEIKHLLPEELKNKLSDLGVELAKKDNSWQAMYEQLYGFVTTHGHTHIHLDKEHEILRDWLTRQIINRSLLTEAQFQQLDSLHVDWEMTVSRDHRWDVMYQRLRQFYYTYGHSRVPQKWSEDKQLALWVQVQRRMHTQGKLLKYREEKLREVDFIWSIQTVFDSQWKNQYEKLKAFYKKHGHTRVPSKNTKLVGWMERQRMAKNQNKLASERKKLLEDIHFIWDFKAIKNKAWEEKYNQLRAYKKEHGNAFVPVNYKENKSLGTWVASQRWLEAKDNLEPGKRKKLDQLGFVWSKDTERKLKAINDQKWEASFNKLKAYKKKHGTCQVSLKVDRVLQRWACWQRKAFYEGKLPQDRLDRLNEIRFPWSIQEGYWMKMYDALIDFKQKFGHTRVPFQWAENHKLADWVYRTRVNKDSLEVQKVELLDDIGFDWSLSRRNVVSWKDMYARLITFKQSQGHTKVPVKWKEDPKLGKWVSRMRHERENLDPERVALLEALEFDWGYKFASNKQKVTSH